MRALKSPGRIRLRKEFVPGLSLLFVVLLQLSGCSFFITKPEVKSTGIIDADNPYIQYIGRFDFSNPQRVVFDWAGVYICAKFEGTSCSLRLKDSTDYYDVVIDDHAPIILHTDSADSIYRVASGLSDSVSHTIMVQKRTEALVGAGVFMGFILDKGKTLLPMPRRPDRRIEFVGNSITSGYGNEADSSDHYFQGSTEDACLSFASITGRELHADYSLISWSGRGVVRNYGDSNRVSRDPMPAFYDRTLATDSTLKWNFKNWIPQAVVINLGTNDFSTHPYPDSAVFVNAYGRLIDHVRSLYPGVTLFCCCGPMIGEPCFEYVKEVVNLQQEKEGRNKDVFFVNMDSSRINITLKDLGLNEHPNIEGAWKMARVLVREMNLRMLW